MTPDAATFELVRTALVVRRVAYPHIRPEEDDRVTPVCDHCSGDITTGNRRFPGYCSAHCRDAHRRARQARHRRKDTDE